MRYGKVKFCSEMEENGSSTWRKSKDNDARKAAFSLSSGTAAARGAALASEPALVLALLAELVSFATAAAVEEEVGLDPSALVVSPPSAA